MPLTTANRETLTSEAHNIEDAVRRSFDRSFERGINKKNVLSTFEAALQGMKKGKNNEAKLRGIAKAAAFSTARRHGNIVQTGRFLLTNIDGYTERFGLNAQLATNQILLGLAEATCQINPIVYGRFLEVAKEYKEDADEWICQNRRLPELPSEPVVLPTVVPFEEELTLRPSLTESTPVKTAQKPEVEAPQTPPEPEVKLERIPEVKGKGWTSTGKKSIFRRLTEVMGSFFSGSFR